MPEPEEEVERIIEAVIKRYSAGNPAMLRQAIVESLWNAGYEIAAGPT
jgi:hypothetical protein